MKKILLSVLTVGLVVSVAIGATRTVFSDTETSDNNTFSAGTLDLTVDGEDDPLGMKFSAADMKPGNTYNGGCVTLHNAGSLDGILTLKVSSVVSNDNGEIEPEIADGDIPGTEVDPTAYDGNAGDGELWDEIATRFWLETGAGSHSSNGTWDWDDNSLYSNFGTPGNDCTGTYHLPIDTDLAADDNYTLAAGASVNFCTDVHFIDKPGDGWDWGHWGALTNNMAMGDDVVFDVVFGLNQTP